MVFIDWFSPRTIRCDVAAATPNGFLIWIRISPASDRRQSLNRSRLWLGSLTIFNPPPSLISVPSLNQLTTIGSWVGNTILNVAFWPALIITGLENLWRSSGSNSGTSAINSFSFNQTSDACYGILYTLRHLTVYLQWWSFPEYLDLLIENDKCQSCPLYSFELGACDMLNFWLWLPLHLMWATKNKTVYINCQKSNITWYKCKKLSERLNWFCCGWSLSVTFINTIVKCIYAS